MEAMESPADLDSTAPTPQPSTHHLSQETTARLASLLSPDPQEDPDQRDLLETQDQTDAHPTVDCADPQDPQDLQEPQDRTEPQDSLESEDPTVLSERFQDQRDPQDPQDHQEPQERMEDQEDQEIQASTVRPDLQETTAEMVPLETQEDQESQEEMESVDPMVAALTAHHPEPPQDIKLEIRISNSHCFKLHEPYFLVLYNSDQVFHLLTRFLIFLPSISISSAKNHRRLQTMGLLFFLITYIFRLPKFRPIPP